MSKPVIGVTTSVDHSLFVWLCIRLGVWLSGGIARRLTANSHAHVEQCSGYIIAGGVDVDPSLYGQENKSSLYLEPERDQLEKLVIMHALQMRKPIAGICRGMQLINVVLGGDLHQEARDIFKAFLPNTSLLAKAFKRRTVSITHQGRLLNMFKAPVLSVNSIHRQAINQLGAGLRISAEDDYGITQGIESVDDQIVYGVQWHPELMLYQKKQRHFFRYLVDAC